MPASDPILVEVEDLNFGYPSARPILTAVNLTVPRGKVVALMGGSGRGKTTLLRLISGQLLIRVVKTFHRSRRALVLPRSDRPYNHDHP